MLVSNKEIIKSRYLYFYGMVALCYIISVLVYIIRGNTIGIFDNSIIKSLIVILVLTIVTSAMIPQLYRYNHHNSGVVMLAFGSIGFILIFIISAGALILVEKLQNWGTVMFAFIIAVTCSITVCFSYRVSNIFIESNYIA